MRCNFDCIWLSLFCQDDTICTNKRDLFVMSYLIPLIAFLLAIKNNQTTMCSTVLLVILQELTLFTKCRVILVGFTSTPEQNL